MSYSIIWNFCRLECNYTYRLGSSNSDYLEHLNYIGNKISETENSEFIIIIHPGRYGFELLEEIDFEKVFKSFNNVQIINASKLFSLTKPYVIDEKLDNHLSNFGNRKLAEFIQRNLK